MQPLLIDAPEMKLLAEETESAIASGSNRRSEFDLAEPAGTFEALNSRATTITPLLEEIFHTRPPIRWGINE